MFLKNGLFNSLYVNILQCVMMYRMKLNTVPFLAMSLVLMLCVPVLGLVAVCLTIKLRRTLRDSRGTLNYRQIILQERTVFWIICFACICFRKNIFIVFFPGVVMMPTLFH